MLSVDQLLSFKHDGDAVLATLVKLDGSGFRRPGARMLITRHGDHVGSISGGCLEKDVARSAFTFVAGGPVRVLYDTRADEFYPEGKYGTGCEGMVYLLLEPYPRPHGFDLLARLRKSREHRSSIVVVTVHGNGTGVGESAILDSFELEFSIGFPEFLKSYVQKISRRCRAGESEQHEIEHGEEVFELLFERIDPRPRVLVFGAGDDAIALAELVRQLGWDPVLCHRDSIRLKDVNVPISVLTNPDSVPLIDVYTSVVFMSHDYEFDREFLPAISASDANYIGLLGPRRRSARLFAGFVESGFAAHLSDRVYAPIGLDLGSDEPTHIALAVAAELVAHLNTRTGGSLSSTKPAFIQTRLPVVKTRILSDVSDLR